MKFHTWELPRIELIEINLGDDGDRKRNRVCFSLEVVNHQFLICGVEPKSRRKMRVLMSVIF